MNKKFLIIFGCLFFLWMGGLLMPAEGLSHDVDFNIGIGLGFPLLPQVVLPAPPSVYLIPNTYAYIAPDVGFDLFFYSGYWYRPYNGYWYRAAYYNGPWYHLPPQRLPYVFNHLPRDYYRVPPGQRRIPYGYLKNHWYERERENYRWDRGHYRGEEDRHIHQGNGYEGRREWKGENRFWGKP